MLPDGAHFCRLPGNIFFPNQTVCQQTNWSKMIIHIISNVSLKTNSHLFCTCWTNSTFSMFRMSCSLPFTNMTLPWPHGTVKPKILFVLYAYSVRENNIVTIVRVQLVFLNHRLYFSFRYAYSACDINFIIGIVHTQPYFLTTSTTVCKFHSRKQKQRWWNSNKWRPQKQQIPSQTRNLQL